jgi:trans-aconitate methyltransferase
LLAGLPVRGDELALDLGCGTGRLTAELLERLPAGKVVAIDRSAAMLAAARDHLTPRFGNRVQFLQADLESLDRRALGFSVDLIFSTATFHWIADHRALFGRLAEMLEPGGWLVAQCGGGPNLARLRARCDALHEREPFRPHLAEWPGPWTFAGADVTAARLRDAGFEVVETSVVPAPTQLADAAAYGEFLTTVIFGQHLARLPDDVTRQSYVDWLTGLAAADDPPFELDYWRLNLRGRRAPRG